MDSGLSLHCGCTMLFADPSAPSGTDSACGGGAESRNAAPTRLSYGDHRTQNSLPMRCGLLTRSERGGPACARPATAIGGGARAPRLIFQRRRSHYHSAVDRDTGEVHSGAGHRRCSGTAAGVVRRRWKRCRKRCFDGVRPAGRRAAAVGSAARAAQNCFAGVANICCNCSAGDMASALLIMALADGGPPVEPGAWAGWAAVPRRWAANARSGRPLNFADRLPVLEGPTTGRPMSQGVRSIFAANKAASSRKGIAVQTVYCVAIAVESLRCLPAAAIFACLCRSTALVDCRAPTGSYAASDEWEAAGGVSGPAGQRDRPEAWFAWRRVLCVIVAVRDRLIRDCAVFPCVLPCDAVRCCGVGCCLTHWYCPRCRSAARSGPSARSARFPGRCQS